MVHFSFTARQLELQERARHFAAEELLPHAAARESAEEIPHTLICKMGALGLLGVNIPEHLGGAGAGAVAYALALREIAQGDAAVAVTMAVTNMVGEVIVNFGTPEQQNTHVRKLTSGEYFGGAFALTEPNAGSDAAGLQTRAEPRDDGYAITGEKMWISTGDKAGVVVVWARTGGSGAQGISTFLVPGNAPGLCSGKPEDKMGLRASHTVPLSLQDVRVHADDFLSHEGGGFAVAMTALDGGRIGIGSQALGIANAALELLRPHARAQDHGAIATMATELDAAWLLTLRAASMKDSAQLSGVDHPNAGKSDAKRYSQEAAMAKVMASEAANRAVREAARLLGKAGYMEHQSAMGRLVRDCRVTQIYEGTSEIQRVVIARNLLRVS